FNPAGSNFTGRRLQSVGYQKFVGILFKTHFTKSCLLSLRILSVSSILGAVNFISTINNIKHISIKPERIPLFVWNITLKLQSIA
ncbi:hypothetical protein L9F63_027084, partial [Diploptera punctata]